jgi:hypothetical protein
MPTVFLIAGSMMVRSASLPTAMAPGIEAQQLGGVGGGDGSVDTLSATGR